MAERLQNNPWSRTSQLYGERKIKAEKVKKVVFQQEKARQEMAKTDPNTRGELKTRMREREV